MIEIPKSTTPNELVNNEEDYKYNTQHSFPSAQRNRKKENHPPKFFEIFKQVKVNIPLLDMIKRTSPNAKFLKYLYTIK